MDEYLRRIDEKDYLTEREHREYLEALDKELTEAKKLKNKEIVKTTGKTKIERVQFSENNTYELPFPVEVDLDEINNLSDAHGTMGTIAILLIDQLVKKVDKLEERIKKLEENK